VAIIRGTTADRNGNISMEKEALTLDALALATAAKNCKGFVIAQVERVAATGSLNPRHVKIPSVLIDCVVVAQPENHVQTYATGYNGAFCGELRAPADRNVPMALDNRKIIARRCALELPMGGVVNLGIGMPEGVASVAAEEKLFDFVTLTAEPGIIGGIPQGGLDFGAAINAESIIDQNQMFDFYDGGGLDLACLGMAQVNASGDVNVSLFNGRLAGAGGFINISQNARELIFAGTFTTGGLKTAIVDGGLKIISEGKSSKFVDKVDQVTFSGRLAAANGQPVLYVTERCVFKLSREGLELLEVAPGIDIDRDILALMGFKPIVKSPRAMDAAIFSEALMRLDDRLLNRPLSERLAFDAGRNTLFLGLDGYRVHTTADVEAIRQAVFAVFDRVGHRFSAVINYDSSDIAPDMADAWFSMAAEVEGRCYDHVSRYTTSAFMRLKLGDALGRRNVAPHIFETSTEAHQFVVE
ncbi:MAG TPA: CoA-transferase, partial [Bradyrhizobium sp.]|nr:CoA-transferase [Bradyrhizobium sp.]